MYCQKCLQATSANATNCLACGEDTSYFRDRLFVGRELIFADAGKVGTVPGIEVRVT